MNWLSCHWQAFRRALARLTVAPLGALLSVVGIGIALALPAGGLLLLDHVAALGRGATTTPQLTVFMAVAADRTAARDIEARLRSRAEVGRTDFLEREATLARMKTSTGLGDVITALPANPFPDAIVATLADDRPAVLESLAAEVGKWPHVEHVQSDADWALRLAAFVRLARNSLFLLAGLLGVGLVTITFNTIRMQVLTRQTEVELSRLLGATNAFIRRPFLWYGALLGLAGGGTAWLMVAGAVLWLRLPVAELAQLYGFDLSLVLPEPAQTVILLGLAALLGWFGAALSLRQQLR